MSWIVNGYNNYIAMGYSLHMNVPEGDIAVLRSYLRQRENLIQNSSTHIQRMQKALTQMNLQLHKVISDLEGVTGLNIIRAIVSGERNPQILAELADKRIKSTPEQISKALTGNYREEMVFILHQELSFYEYYQQQILALYKEIEQCLSKFKSETTSPPPEPKRQSVIVLINPHLTYIPICIVSQELILPLLMV